MHEAQAFRGDAVEGRSLHHGIPIGPRVGVALVIGDAEKNVGPFAAIGNEAQGGKRQKR